MRQSKTGEGTKIAQAAKELNVTSVTIRRYISEFNLETTTDENGVKVLPAQAMEELKEIRRLKEEGLTNPKVLEILEEGRNKAPAQKAKVEKKGRETKKIAATTKKVEEQEQELEQEESYQPAKRTSKTSTKGKIAKEQAPELEPEQEESEEEEESTTEVSELNLPTRSKHSLTCQTCGKVFEHMNPKLRDCLDCYRTKRRERRRGGSDRHKNVIQHPLAQQATTKSFQPMQNQSQELSVVPPRSTQPTILRQSTVRNYRKAIEDTRHITANLKRRLERPDLSEGERRWLEQIYAYQLILHQGWRHLSEYKQASQQQGRSERPE